MERDNCLRRRPRYRYTSDLNFVQETHMLPRRVIRSALFALVCGVFSGAHAAVVYNESVSGDLSNSGLTPTAVSVGLGSNAIMGSTGFVGDGVDRDYFSIIV